jgi:beta-glucosidase
MPWRREVAAITLAFLPGQAYGDALAGLLLGESSPSAKLPLTIPAEEGQPSFAHEQYPGTHEGPLQPNAGGLGQPEAWWLQAGEGQQRVTRYSEGLLLGYRWFDAKNVTPAFAFGHGLTYTSFELLKSSLNQSRDEVSCVLRNSGKRKGVETLQLYLGLPYPDKTKAPPLQLKGFAKTALGPGESTVVRFALTSRHRSTWDEKAHAWAEVSGRVEVVVGSSSRDDAALRGNFVMP